MVTLMPRITTPSTCIQCGATYYRLQGAIGAKYCSQACYHEARRSAPDFYEKNANIARKFRDSIQYTAAARGDQHSTYYRKVNGRHEHRVVMEQVLGRPLESHEIVHHKDGDKRNNAPENLEIMTRAQHYKHHVHGSNPRNNPALRGGDAQ
jgi:hypothetical protein